MVEPSAEQPGPRECVVCGLGLLPGEAVRCAKHSADDAWANVDRDELIAEIRRLRATRSVIDDPAHLPQCPTCDHIMLTPQQLANGIKNTDAFLEHEANIERLTKERDAWQQAFVDATKQSMDSVGSLRDELAEARAAHLAALDSGADTRELLAALSYAVGKYVDYNEGSSDPTLWSKMCRAQENAAIFLNTGEMPDA